MKWKYVMDREMSVLFEYMVHKGIRDYTAEVLNLQEFNLKGRKYENGRIYHDESELRELRRRVESRLEKESYLEIIADACERQCRNVVSASTSKRKSLNE